MSDGPTFGRREDDVILAGEYVLGLLSDLEREAFEKRIARDPLVREIVAGWAEDMTPLTEGPEIKPPRRVQSRIQKELFAENTSASGLVARIFKWGLGGLAGATAAALIVLGTMTILEPAPPSLVAEISGEQGLGLQAVVREDRLTVARLGPPPAEGRSYELWLIVGEAAPVSLGLLDGDRERLVRLDDFDVATLDGALLALSDEPFGGSPTGAPTGSVLAAGPLVDAQT
ncbi:MAG: anti-sigma factor [Shimia sp.]